MGPVSIDFSISLDGIAIVTAVTAAAVILFASLQGIGRHISIHTFNDYSQRYHQILARFPIQIWTTKGITLGSFTDDQVSTLLETYGEFLRLLAGERHLHQTGFLDARTWKLWNTSTRNIMALPVSKEAWERLRPGFSYDPKFQKFVDGLL